MPDVDEHGRLDMPSAGSEIETLLGLLDYQRATMCGKCRGLDDDQLQAGLRSSALTLGGLLKRLARHNGHADLIRESIDGETGE